MHPDNLEQLSQRVERAAEAALEKQRYVSATDVLVGMGWLAQSHLDAWRQGRVDYLERVVHVNLHRLSTAMKIFRRWAEGRGLKPSETVYVSRTRDRRRLRFSKSGNPDIERAYRTHWVSPALSEKKQAMLAEKQSKPPELLVIWPVKEWTCTTCGGTGDLLMMEEPGPLCLSCADLDHLVYLPAGDAALTRRAKAKSRLSAVVVRFSRSRRHYERQGLLVEEKALAAAEAECLADEEVRELRQRREVERRADQDARFQAEMVEEILRLFPLCPRERAEAIARHTGARGSGRVGRSAAGRALDPQAITLAVVASVRHSDTRYDELLMAGLPRREAREAVQSQVQEVLDQWCPND